MDKGKTWNQLLKKVEQKGVKVEQKGVKVEQKGVKVEQKGIKVEQVMLYFAQLFLKVDKVDKVDLFPSLRIINILLSHLLWCK